MTNPIVMTIVGIIALYLVIQIFMKPIKLLWKLLLNSAIGLVLLVIVNYLGAYFAFSLPINVVTVLVSGFFGLPGIIVLICLQLFM